MFLGENVISLYRCHFTIIINKTTLEKSRPCLFTRIGTFKNGTKKEKTAVILQICGTYTLILFKKSHEASVMGLQPLLVSGCI